MFRPLVQKLLPIERSWTFPKDRARPRADVVTRLVEELRAARATELEVGLDGFIRFHTGLFRFALMGNPLNGVAAGEMRVTEDATHIVVGCRVEFRGCVINAFLAVVFCVWVATGVLGCVALPVGVVVGAVGCGLLLAMFSILRGQGLTGLVHRAALQEPPPKS